MQLADVGRNEPCPCGSGRKYKKCCLDAPDVAAASAPSDLDLAALVDRAIENDDWAPVHEVFDHSFTLFEAGKPLEHVRFRDPLISSRPPELLELARLGEADWLRFAEREICHVLERYELSEAHRNGLRLMVYLLRRFGAKSPVVEAVAELQAGEHQGRARMLADLVSRHGLTLDDVMNWRELAAWVVRTRPSVLPFADWFALQAGSDAEAEALWLSGIAMRVCDGCLGRLDRQAVIDALPWLRLAAIALFGRTPDVGITLARLTSPEMKTEDERMVHTVLTTNQPDARLRGSIERIIAETDARDDFAGAALLRRVQQRVRGRQPR